MRVSCQPGGRSFAIADDKVPDRPFAVTCPTCREKLRIDPDHVQDGAIGVLCPNPKAEMVDDAPSRATPAPAEEAPAPVKLTAAELAGELPPLRPTEEELLAELVPVAFVIDLDGAGDLDHGNLNHEALGRLGFRDVQTFDTIEAAVELFDQVLPGLLLVRTTKAAVPFSPLAPIVELPGDERRRVFVTLVADNVRSLDGSVAFLLQVDTLVNSGDLPHLAPLLRRALLHHVQLYRHWPRDE